MSTLSYVARGFVPTCVELSRWTWIRWTLVLLGAGAAIGGLWWPPKQWEVRRQLIAGTLEGMWSE